MEPTRIPPANSLPAPGLESVQQSDPQHPVKQVQQEDQVQFSAESEQVARLKSEMDATVDRQNSSAVGLQKHVAEKKSAAAPLVPGKDSSGEAGNRLDVEG